MRLDLASSPDKTRQINKIANSAVFTRKSPLLRDIVVLFG